MLRNAYPKISFNINQFFCFRKFGAADVLTVMPLSTFKHGARQLANIRGECSSPTNPGTNPGTLAVQKRFHWKRG